MSAAALPGSPPAGVTLGVRVVAARVGDLARRMAGSAVEDLWSGDAAGAAGRRADAAAVVVRALAGGLESAAEGVVHGCLPHEGAEARGAARVRDAAERCRGLLAGLRAIDPLDLGAGPAVRRWADRTARTRLWEGVRESLAEGDQRRAQRLAALAADTRRHLLMADARGDGRVVEVLGDPTRARRAVVVVPGVGSDLESYARGLAPRAEALHAELLRRDPATVTIAWLGYDSPSWMHAPFDDHARRAAPALGAIVRDLRGVMPRGSRITVVGHSYGSLVTGFAARAGMPADAVVLVGSPGVGVDRAADLRPAGIPVAGCAHASAGRAGPDVYAMRAPGDVVGWSEAFGRDPADARFGARRLPTGRVDRSGGAPVSGHSAYFAAGSESLHAMATVVLEASPDRESAVGVAATAARQSTDCSGPGLEGAGSGGPGAHGSRVLEAYGRLQRLGWRLGGRDLPSDLVGDLIALRPGQAAGRPPAVGTS